MATRADSRPEMSSRRTLRYRFAAPDMREDDMGIRDGLASPLVKDGSVSIEAGVIAGLPLGSRPLG